MRLIGLMALTALAGNLWAGPQPATGPVKAQQILYLSGVHTMQGTIYKPKGEGPFAAVVFNQATKNSNETEPFSAIAQLFTRQGYVFFVPGKHQLGPDDTEDDSNKDEKVLQNHEKHAANIKAAVVWLRA